MTIYLHVLEKGGIIIYNIDCINYFDLQTRYKICLSSYLIYSSSKGHLCKQVLFHRNKIKTCNPSRLARFFVMLTLFIIVVFSHEEIHESRTVFSIRCRFSRFGLHFRDRIVGFKGFRRGGRLRVIIMLRQGLLIRHIITRGRCFRHGRLR